MDTQTQVERLIELAIVQRTELRQLVEQLPQLRDHLNAEIERTFEEVEPQIRVELEEFCRARATDEHAKTGAALAAKVDDLSKKLEATTSAKYSVLLAERAHNVELERIATEQVAQAANQIPQQVKAIVADELSRFPRAGEIDQLRKEFATPAGLNPRGKWQSGQTYQRLDVVSYNGNSYIANATTSEKPSVTSEAWTINAARGVGGGGPSSLNELTQTPTNGSLLIGSGTSWVTSTLTAGTGIAIANAAGSITITSSAGGTVALDDGTAAAPSLNFTNDTDTGIYRIGANNIGVAAGGAKVLDVSTTGLSVDGMLSLVKNAAYASTIEGAQTVAATGNSFLFKNSGASTLLTLAYDATATFAGAVTVSSTTAGASNAGALVVAGGISAGNTGSAASYFGGALNVAGAATFAGILTVSSTETQRIGGSTRFGNNDNAVVEIEGSGTNRILFFNRTSSAYIDGNYDGLSHTFKVNSDAKFTLASTGNATFAGAVAIGNTVNTVSPTSPNRTITMVVNGVTLYLAAKTTND